LHHVAIDLHDQYSQICVMNQAREILAEAKVPTTRAALNDFFRQRARCRVIYEAGPHALWVSELLTTLGHEPLACHPRRVRLIAESRNKNDRVDAELLARLSLSDLELIKPIQQRSRATLEERSVVRARAALVETQKRLRTMLRGLVKPFGVRLTGGKRRVLAELATLDLPPQAAQSVEAIRVTLATIAEQIYHLDSRIEKLSASQPAAARLQTIPGIGALIAITYIYAIEDPARFASTDVGPYLGLTPSNRSSAGKKLGPKEKGRPGDPYLRSLLIQAAWTLMNSRSESDLARWGRQLVDRVGPKKAAVAVARKLATLMHHLWLYDQDFRAHPKAHPKIAAA
jgi:transposase